MCVHGELEILKIFQFCKSQENVVFRIKILYSTEGKSIM